MTAQPGQAAKLHPVFLTLGAAALGLLLWTYWTTLGDVAWRWNHDPQYSHGFLVPGFALYLLWVRRQRVVGQSLSPSAWGFALLGVGVAVRLAGTYYHYAYLDQISLLPCLAGLVTLVGGWQALAWAWPAVGFLGFMIPLPHSLSLAMSGPMQGFATVVSTFLLQTLGRPALAEGNVILLNEIELGIVEACSGLRMLVVFFALSTAVAMLIRKPLWEKTLIALSAIPIALASNVLRITITGLFYDSFGANWGGALFHDLAGWLMMPLGLAFLGLELLILQKLLLEVTPTRPLPSQISLQHIEVSPVSLYRGNSTRRDKRPSTPAAEPAPAPEPAPESVSQS